MSNEINYSASIANFNAMTGNSDEDLALKYLTSNNWDETVNNILLIILIQKAATEYFNNFDANIQSNTNVSSNTNVNNSERSALRNQELNANRNIPQTGIFGGFMDAIGNMCSYFHF